MFAPKPNFFCKHFQGANAPKKSVPRVSLSSLTYLSQLKLSSSSTEEQRLDPVTSEPLEEPNTLHPRSASEQTCPILARSPFCPLIQIAAWHFLSSR
jgi:hypothetical protein